MDYINSLKLDEKINHWQDLKLLVNKYLSSVNITHQQNLDIIDCLRGIRMSRFIDSNVDIEILDAALLIARSLDNQNEILREILNDILYYSNFHPEKYTKLELEKELKELEET